MELAQARARLQVAADDVEKLSIAMPRRRIELDDLDVSIRLLQSGHGSALTVTDQAYELSHKLIGQVHDPLADAAEVIEDVWRSIDGQLDASHLDLPAAHRIVHDLGSAASGSEAASQNLRAVEGTLARVLQTPSRATRMPTWVHTRVLGARPRLEAASSAINTVGADLHRATSRFFALEAAANEPTRTVELAPDITASAQDRASASPHRLAKPDRNGPSVGR